MPRTARPPWQNDAAVELLRQRAPDAPLSEHPKRWLALVVDAFTGRPKSRDAAEHLGVAQRTLENWVQILRAEHADLYAQLPERQKVGRAWPAKKPTSQDGA
ncbi:MAG: hypothetical protein JWM10_3474 [Myxococcaceae bacterium]|nr:hypothetical protein [Myxococcaceae bacterium]